jgi:hypothetical protein
MTDTTPTGSPDGGDRTHADLTPEEQARIALSIAIVKALTEKVRELRIAHERQSSDRETR